MKITIEAEPKEISELLQAISSSEEQNIEIDGSKIIDTFRCSDLRQERSKGIR